ncbi:EcoKI restriction-modification system protein HsdS [Polystyrenella longa]|uniref:EcoKI restriction-modification system protein HsdS n=1 Tax=Polystyrenella longa TaxID=2528007 RepID=A0A518CU82_9PLAN|nr:restriction endonuclease subunit S [Polystyrenella longa]QDU82786.1 EcoKI restriction-modification system protein HsdS [Polystyrenella longa]
MKTWKHTTIGPHIDLLSGYAFKSNKYSSNENDVMLLRGDNIVQGQLRWDGVKRWSVLEVDGLSRYELKEGDIVLAMDRTWVKAGLKCARLTAEDLPCLLVQRVARMRGSDDLEIEFLYHTLLTHRFTEYVKGVQTETAIPHISTRQIREFPIHLPPLPEQQKIAAILSTWDRAIELTEKLIAAKQKRKQALMQQLLTGKVRLPDFDEEWSLRKAGDLFNARSMKKHPNEPVLSVTQDQGVVRRDELDRKISMDETTTGTYKLVEPEDFVISLRSFQGGLEMSRLRGIVSPAYHVIRPKVKLDSEYFRHFFKSAEFIGRLAVAIIGIRDGKQIAFDDFSFLNFRFPPVEEQSEIGRVLTLAENEIELLQKKLASLQSQKRGLMQQLLTGKVRVNVDQETEAG